jgi:4-aminobutyrate aminotransferase-like enzyme
VVTVGKAFGGGFPVSGLITTDEIAKAKPWSNPSGSSSSYGGNPLAAAAAATSLAIIDEEMLVENARVVGAMMLRELEGFVDRYPFVGHARGAGLFLGLELVKDKQTREPLARRVTERIFHECVARGLLCMVYAASFRLQPALTIDEATARNGLAILREVFDWVEREKIWQD